MFCLILRCISIKHLILSILTFIFQGHNNFGRGGYRNNRHNKDAPISSYMDASMTEDPWMDLERDLLSSRQDKTTSSEPSMTSNSPNLPDEDENNQIR